MDHERPDHSSFVDGLLGWIQDFFDWAFPPESDHGNP